MKNKPEKPNRYYAYYEAQVFNSGIRVKYRKWLKNNIKFWRWKREAYSDEGTAIKNLVYMRIVFKRSCDRNLFILMHPNSLWHSTEIKSDEYDYFFDNSKISKWSFSMMVLSISVCMLNVSSLIFDILKANH